MADSQPPPEPQTDQDRRPHMSLAARLLNVFAVPGQVFSELNNSPTTVANWLVPVILAALVGVVSVQVLLSEPSLDKQLRERLSQSLQEQVKTGKLTPQYRQWIERLPIFKLLGGIGSVLGNFLSVLWWGFILWFLARRMLHAPVPFQKALETAGLAMMIGVLATIVMTLLIIKVGRLGSGLGWVLVVKDFETLRRSVVVAAAANVFSFWIVGVRAVGLAKLTGAPFLRAAWLVLTVWVLEQCVFVIIGLGQVTM